MLMLLFLVKKYIILNRKTPNILGPYATTTNSSLTSQASEKCKIATNSF
jgi:hypothetical protein